MDAMTLRRAGVQDAEALAALAYDTFRETFIDGFAIPYPPQDLAAFIASTYTAAVFERKLRDPRQATWIVEREGEPLGYANTGPCTLPHPNAEPEQPELYRLYVRHAAQGLRIGRRLMDAALAWMEARGPVPIWLGVWSGNVKAQRFYAGYGFEKVGDYHFPVGAWRDDEFILRRLLRLPN